MNISNDRPLVRWTPKMDPQKYRTYRADAPLTTHFRRGRCDDPQVDCHAYINGWSFNKAALSAAQYYRVTHSGKRYREVELAPGQHYLVFEAGQFCFDRHMVRIQRPEIYLTGRGDWRIFNPNHAKRIPTTEEFAERFGKHIDLLNEVKKRG